MSFAKELEDFATSFQKTYTAVKPSAYDRMEAEKLGALQAGADAAGGAAGAGRTPNLSTNWARGDTPGAGIVTPSISALPTVEGGEATSSEITDTMPSDLARAGITPRAGVSSATPTFARGTKAAGMESDIAAAKAAIAGNESGGRYDAMGPVTSSGDRAYGKYQVMGKNIPQWTQAAIGRAMTPQEFKSSPQAQEAVFEHYFGNNMRKYGFDDAASIWFSGRRASAAGGAKDVLGTSVPKYISMARATYNKFRPAQHLSRGGLVQAVPFAATGGVIEESTPAEEGNAEGHDLMELGQPTGIADIIDQAMGYGTKVFGLDRAAIQGADPHAADGARALAMNVGAATPEQVQTVHKTVDPQGEMNPAMRQIAGYKGIYQYWMARGEPEKAQRAVFAMAMAAKDAAQTYGTVALQAAQRGDTKMAAEAIAKGYEEVPDGHTLKVTKAGPEGAQFELHDINGNVTEKGQLAMDEMIRVATGMTSGTEWLKSMGAIRTRTDKAGAALEKRRTALEQFHGADGGKGDERDYVATLSPEKRKAYLALDPRDQRDLRNLHFRELDQARKQLNFDTRRGDVIDKREHDDAMKLFGMSVRQKNWETTREQVMTNAEKAFALKARDLSDRNARFDENREDKLKRWAEVDKRILEQRQIRGAGSGKVTADERKTQAVNTTADTALANERMAVPEMTGFDAPERQEAFNEAAGRVGAARTYEAQEATRKGQPAVGDQTMIRTGITEATAKANLSPEKQNMLVGVASHIARANMDVDEPTAINIALAAGSRNTPIRFERDRLDPNKVRVQVGNTQPVVMGSEALSTIAMIRGGALRPSGVPAGQPTIMSPEKSSTAGPTAALPVPGMTGNPDQRVERGGPRAMNPVEHAKAVIAAHELQKRKFKRDNPKSYGLEVLSGAVPIP